jgi:hypothetical protein
LRAGAKNERAREQRNQNLIKMAEQCIDPSIERPNALSRS